MSKSTKSIYTHVFKNKPKKAGYYIRVSDMDTEPVFIGTTVNEGFENFEARFPESWASKQWWIEKCLHVSAFGDFTWDNFDHSDKFI